MEEDKEDGNNLQYVLNMINKPCPSKLSERVSKIFIEQQEVQANKVKDRRKVIYIKISYHY